MSINACMSFRSGWMGTAYILGNCFIWTGRKACLMGWNGERVSCCSGYIWHKCIHNPAWTIRWSMRIVISILFFQVNLLGSCRPTIKFSLYWSYGGLRLLHTESQIMIVEAGAWGLLGHVFTGDIHLYLLHLQHFYFEDATDIISWEAVWSQ